MLFPLGTHASSPRQAFHVMSHLWTCLLQSQNLTSCLQSTVLRNWLWLPDFETFLERLTASSALATFVHSPLQSGTLAWPAPQLLTTGRVPVVRGALFQVASVPAFGWEE